MASSSSTAAFNSSSSSESRDSQYEPRSPQPATPTFSEDARLMQTPTSPLASDFGQRALRSSPLNPSSPSTPSFMRPMAGSIGSMSSRPDSRASSSHQFIPSKQPSYEPSPLPSATGSRGSMILYRLADDPSTVRDSLLMPPRFAGGRDSVASTRSSMISFSDSKYPSGIPQPRGLVPYEYDPEADESGPADDEDFLHDPNEKGGVRGDKGAFPWRGILNVSVLVLLILGLLSLFVIYPVITYYRTVARNRLIDGNIRINATGQAPVLFQMPQLIDPDTPPAALSRTGFDGEEYSLVFSDEFNVEGRSFYPGDDPFWEAVDLWYGATGDVEWYDPAQVTTRDGALIITIDSVATTQSGVTPGSTAPFTRAENHDLEYRSGMIQTWNKFCFTSGYIEVSVTFPGPNEDTAGYWPGAWTMGNLARPGYPATTDGVWPYTYDVCDLGTFPNQTNPDGQTPAAAIFSSASRDRYNNELSWLSGQRLSACSCPGSDHPGPTVERGRGAPEIDVFEASKDKQADHGGTVSQSAQFAPFSHDYIYQNDTLDKWRNYSPERTRANAFRGSAVQQSVSGVTRVPSGMFQGSGETFTSFGFEYYGNPDHRDQGYVMWQVDGSPTHRVGYGAVGPDPEPTGSGIGQRIIPEEPMSIILNLGMSPNWQTIDISTMSFPGEMKVDYVRVYQRKNEINIGCDPKEYPTAKYINDHLEAFMDVNMTTWKWPLPRNRLWEGGSC